MKQPIQMNPNGGNPVGQPQIDISKATDLVCNCGGDTFVNGFRFKKVSKIMTGTPDDAIIPIEVFLCGDCGEPLEELLPKELRKPKLKK